MRNRGRFRISTERALLAVLLAWVGASYAQESPAPKRPIQSEPLQQTAITSVAIPCVQPPPTVDIRDYNGPLKKTVGLFARELERKSVHPPHYKPGLALCSLDLKDKFSLFVRDSFDPVTFLGAGFNAGVSQVENQDPTFGRDPTGYGKRFGAVFSDQASSKFFKDFAYPAIFYEDPRYYRLMEGSGRSRFFHAIEHSFVARRDNGNRMLNYSEWLGTTSVVALSNLYHPGNERGFSPAARSVGYNVLTDTAFDVLREFWPEISLKFKLPFHAEPGPEDLGSNPTRH